MGNILLASKRNYIAFVLPLPVCLMCACSRRGWWILWGDQFLCVYLPPPPKTTTALLGVFFPMRPLPLDKYQSHKSSCLRDMMCVLEPTAFIPGCILCWHLYSACIVIYHEQLCESTAAFVAGHEWCSMNLRQYCLVLWDCMAEDGHHGHHIPQSA
jgi:hypothetical protein